MKSVIALWSAASSNAGWIVAKAASSESLITVGEAENRVSRVLRRRKLTTLVRRLVAPIVRLVDRVDVAGERRRSLALQKERRVQRDARWAEQPLEQRRVGDLDDVE